MWIKICANTNLADAQLAAQLGADALGFVFAPSARQVTADEVATITPHLPASVETIAVVSTRDAGEIVEIVRRTGVTGVQLHGSLDLALVQSLDAAFEGRVQLIQTLHWSVEDDGNSAALVIAQLREIATEPAIARVLLDAKVGKASGGTGRSFNWSAARAALDAATMDASQQAGARLDAQPAASRPIDLILAGGLHPDNIGVAIQAFGPWGVDVASGVEASPGRKDPLKLRRFLEQARAQEDPQA